MVTAPIPEPKILDATDRSNIDVLANRANTNSSTDIVEPVTMKGPYSSSNPGEQQRTHLREIRRSDRSTGDFHRVPPEEPGHTSAIIGDSNVRFMRMPNCRTVCYPGADFAEATEIVDSIAKATCTRDFYICFGYTQLEGKIDDTFLQCYTKSIVELTRRLPACRFFVVGLSVSSQLDCQASGRASFINKEIHLKFADHYVPPLRATWMKTEHHNGDRIRFISIAKQHNSSLKVWLTIPQKAATRQLS